MKKVLRFIDRYPLLVLFTACLLLLTVLDIAFSNREFSETENRTLAQRPALTWDGLMDNSFGQAYDKYLSDQFVGRDGWITLKSLLWTATGRTENNGVLFGSDGSLFEKLFTYDKEKVERNVGYLEKFAQSCPYPLTFMMIPNSCEVYPERLPTGAEEVEQKPLIDAMYGRMSAYADCVDLCTLLCESGDPYLFYRTDHHWTTDGAYIGYEALCKAWKLEPCDRSQLERREVENFCGTYYSKSKAVSAKPDTIVWYPMDDVEMEIRYVTQSGEFYTEVYDSLYNEEQFEAYDKYAAFLYSNNDLTVITNKAPSEAAKGKSVCVIKDSYANSMIPYLTRNFETVTVIDIRYFNGALSEYLAENEFDRVLVMYNFSTFNTENIAMISR